MNKKKKAMMRTRSDPLLMLLSLHFLFGAWCQRGVSLFIFMH
jgi:hypothetical protein